MAAYASGIETVLIPRDNERDLDEIDGEARAHLNFIVCDTVMDALRHVLTDMPPLQAASEEGKTPILTPTDNVVRQAPPIH